MPGHGPAMAITVKCSCGKCLQARDDLAGKKARCPGCGSVLTLPPPMPILLTEAPVAFEVVAGPPPSERRQRRRDEPEYDDDIDDPPPRPRSKSGRRRKKYRHTALFDGDPEVDSRAPSGFGTTNAGVIGGAVMIGIALIWLV